MLYASLKLIHLLSIVVWVGGMVFAHFFLRPATQALEPAVRVRLMHDVLERFFAAVLVAVVLMLASGVWMIGNFARQVVQSGGSFAMPLGWTVMATLGLVMVAIFGHIRFALYKRLQRAVAATDWPTGGKALIGIRTWVGINLALGVLTVAVALLMYSALLLALLPVLPPALFQPDCRTQACPPRPRRAGCRQWLTQRQAMHLRAPARSARRMQ